MMDCMHSDEDVYAPQVPIDNINIGDPEQEIKTPANKIGSGVIDFVQTLVVFGAIFAIIYLFIAQPHKVSGLSMFPNFHNADYILTDKLTYHFADPKDGDVIVLKNPQDETQDFIKRVMAGPGQTIQVQGGSVYVDGKQVDEKYLPVGTPTRGGNSLHEGELIKVSSDHYYVFGDNREHSSDSRAWGPITKEEIIGRVIFRYFPINALGIIRNGFD